MLLSFIEIAVGDYSFVENRLFRRLFSVVVQTQGYYWDFILNSPPPNWYWVTGGINSDFAVTFYVGDQYRNLASANENTNAFLYAFGQNGVLGYIWAVIIIPCIFLFFDRMYHKENNKVWMFVSFMFAALLLEQGYTTVLLSSGIAFLSVLFFVTKTETGVHSGASGGI